MNTDRIITDDAFDVLQELDAESAHAVVTDPPYGLAFMGRDWDSFEPKEYQEWCEQWAREVIRVLKPGGHLLAFSGNRTHHRLFTGVEDAGFEIRDTLTWHYGSGFPKAADISKTIDKREGVEPDRVEDTQESGMWRDDSEWNDCYNHEIYETATTDAAKEWDGWKTGLKPATEYVVMARKPFDGATVDCVLDHGTGALNIDGTRIDHDGDDLSGGGAEAWDKMSEGYQRPYMQDDDKMENVQKEVEAKVEKAEQDGRYPSNVVFDEIEAERLDREVGNFDGRSPQLLNDNAERDIKNAPDKPSTGEVGYADSGGPSRYFYTSKATKAERDLDGKIDNGHPTVKPQDLMEWLVKLVTREEQLVIDPFCGSGTTCKAAKELNRRFIGIEKQDKWADVARVRCNLTPENPAVVRGDTDQHGIEQFTD